jgi:hypothetical protein
MVITYLGCSIYLASCPVETLHLQLGDVAICTSVHVQKCTAPYCVNGIVAVCIQIVY